MSSICQSGHRDVNSSFGDFPKLRLAIIGCGPRGLQCLETIGRRLNPDQRANLSITIFEPAPYPGAGCVYDPTQPPELKMNFATQHIDFWKFATNQASARSMSLLSWLAKRYPQFARTDQYVPRAIVGEYLTDCMDTVLQTFRRDQVEIIPQRVINVKRSPSSWTVTSDDGTHWSVDQIMLTTGHEGLRVSNALGRGDSQRFVLPTQQHLTSEHIPPGSRVRLNGFGLTAIDAILSLTVGRGGLFTNTSAMLPSYLSSPDQPHCIDIHSRSGRPMLAKPTAAVEPISDTFWDLFRVRLRARMKSHGHLNFRRDIWSVVVAAAAELLARAGESLLSTEVESWFRGWSRYKMDAITARRAMLQSYAVAIGKRKKDIPYALAEAWRNLYPELTRLIGFGGLADEQWSSFSSINAEMERIAFGPPAENMASLLSLIRHRVVRLACHDSCVTGYGMKPSDGRRAYDCIVNAVIAPPHQASTGGPVARLIQQGWVQLDHVTGAVKVSHSGDAVGPAQGLAVFGRATEGWVVGNDTLNRTLHPQMERWADRLIETLKTHRGNALQP